MRTPFYVLAAAACAVISAPAQHEVLYYRFDAPIAGSAASSSTVNFVGGAAAAPSEGALSLGPATLGAGRFGSGLAGGFSGQPAHSVDTGWIPVITGSFTIAMFVRNHGANIPTQRATLFGESGGFAGTVGATPHGGFVLSGWGGNDLVLEDGLAWCFVNDWTHVALVVDAAAGEARLFRDGVVVATEPLPAMPAVAAAATLHIGDDGTAVEPSLFDIDEARVLQRAATAAEIASWSVAPSAAVAAFGAGMGVGLTTFGGMPYPGNAGFGLRVQGVAQAPVLLVLGHGRSHIDLAATLGSGFATGILYVTPDVVLGGVAGLDGVTSFELPLPATLAAEGEWFAQGLTFDGQLHTSQGLAGGFGSPQ